MYTVPLFFQITRGDSSTAAGAHLLPAVLGVTCAGLVGGYLTKRYALNYFHAKPLAHLILLILLP
jgi:predicted TIM-barrel enzyme